MNTSIITQNTSVDASLLSAVEAPSVLKAQVEYLPNILQSNQHTSLSIREALSVMQDPGLQPAYNAVQSAALFYGTDSPEYKTAKQQLPAFCFQGTVAPGQELNAKNLKSLSGVMVLDCDHLENADAVLEAVCLSPHVAAAFKSPSGEGVKILIHVEYPEAVFGGDVSAAAYTNYYKQLQTQASVWWPWLETDNSSCNINRLCFASPHKAYVNENPQVVGFTPYVAPVVAERTSAKYTTEQMRALLAQIDPALPEALWIKVMMACEDDDPAWLGEFDNWSSGQLHNEGTPGNYVNFDTIKARWDHLTATPKRPVGERVTLGSIERLARLEDQKNLDWSAVVPEPTPLPNDVKIRTTGGIPDHMVPSGILSMANEVSRFLHTNREAAILTAISTASMALNKNVIIKERDGLQHNCSLGFVILEISGARKTEQYKLGGAPWFEYEEQCIRNWEGAKPLRKVQAKRLEKELKDIMGDMSNIHYDEHGVPVETEKVRQAVQCEKALETLKVPKPVFNVGDITEEKLIRMTHGQGEVMSVCSDDARNIIDNIMGRYGKGQTREGFYICGLTGSPYSYHRKGSDSDEENELVLRHPCINMLLFIQPDKILKMLDNDSIRDSGLMARLMMFAPDTDPDKLLRMSADEADLNPQLLEPFYEPLRALCGKYKAPVVVSLSRGARESWGAATHTVADWLQDDPEFAHNYELINKFVTIVVKWATIITALETPGFKDKEAVEIQKGTFDRAMELVEYYTRQNMYVYNHYVHVKFMDMVRGQLAWFKKHPEVATFKCDRTFINSVTQGRRKKIREILAELVNYGWLIKNGEEYTTNIQEETLPTSSPQREGQLSIFE